MHDLCCHYFEKDTRYYRIALLLDLWETWNVKREWGNIQRRSVRSLVMPQESYETGVCVVEAMVRRRLKRGYREIVEPDASCEDASG